MCGRTTSLTNAFSSLSIAGTTKSIFKTQSLRHRVLNTKRRKNVRMGTKRINSPELTKKGRKSYSTGRKAVGEAIRDVVEDFSQKALVGTDSVNLEEDLAKVFKFQRLGQRKTVTHYTFESKVGWKDLVPQVQRPKIHGVMSKMPYMGKLDVIVLGRVAQTSVVGSTQGKTNPHESTLR